MKKDIIVVKLPTPNKKITGPWCTGYPIHKGHKSDSLNFATLYSHEKGIIPDQKVLRQQHNNFLKTLRQAGFKIHFLDFPKKLNQPNNLHHDALFIRDSGMFFGKYWIKSNYSARARQAEADTFAPIIAKKFNKKIIQLPTNAFLEFGEVAYFDTKDGDYYFGGLSRANKKGHDFVRKIIKPKNYILVESHGYHLDTLLSPVIDKNNKLVALIVAKDLLTGKGLEALKKTKIKLIFVRKIDSSGYGKKLGNYSVNTLYAPGILVGSSYFSTKGIEEKLKKMGIKHFVCPLIYFDFAGGSCHCLTNELR